MLLALALAIASCEPPPGAVRDPATILKAYNERSLEILRIARQGDDKQLSRFIWSDAAFSLGGGDVGRPLGEGVAGARAMAADLQGTEPNFLADSELTPSSDPCGTHDAAVGFGTANGERWTVVTFHYDAGKLESAKGWWTSLNDGWNH